MRKLLIFHVCVILFVLSFFACRKTEERVVVSDVKSKLESGIERRFFESPGLLDPTTRGIMTKIQDRNKQDHFVEGIVSKIGFPYWNKSLVLSASRTGVNSVNEPLTILLVPFAIDSQYAVNSFLIVKIEGQDTTYKYLMNWQYQNLQFGNSLTSMSAEEYAFLFMSFDNYIFGHEKFRITNDSLFNNNSSSVSSPVRNVGVTQSFSKSGFGARSNLEEIMCVWLHLWQS